MSGVRLQIPGEDSASLDAILQEAATPSALYVFAHGAGAGMTHTFMESFSRLLLDRNISCLRFNFPYMAAGRRYPDRPDVLRQSVAAVLRYAADENPGVRILAGGKSMGGRITADAVGAGVAIKPDGLVFLGYPLHAPGKDSIDRAALLAEVDTPLLFLQGSRDKLARLDLLEGVLQNLPQATLHVVPEGDHSFNVPKRTGRSHEDVLADLADTIVDWLPSTAQADK